MELTPRLKAVAQQVPAGARFADIGTDHAYLPVWLLLNGVISHAIAADLREGPLERARQTAEHYGVTDQMSFRLCDGLSAITGEETDTIAIAGMGGDTIAMILEAAPWTKEPGKTLLLQPMTAFPELRGWLQANGFSIEKETVAREGKRLYSIWTVVPGEMAPLSPAELWAGRQSIDPLRGPYLEHIITKVTRALEGHKAAARKDERAIAELTQVLSGLQIMKEECDTWQK